MLLDLSPHVGHVEYEAAAIIFWFEAAAFTSTELDVLDDILQQPWSTIGASPNLDTPVSHGFLTHVLNQTTNAQTRQGGAVHHLCAIVGSAIKPSPQSSSVTGFGSGYLPSPFLSLQVAPEAPGLQHVARSAGGRSPNFGGSISHGFLEHTLSISRTFSCNSKKLGPGTCRLWLRHNASLFHIPGL